MHTLLCRHDFKYALYIHFRKRWDYEDKDIDTHYVKWKRNFTFNNVLDILFSYDSLCFTNWVQTLLQYVETGPKTCCMLTNILLKQGRNTSSTILQGKCRMRLNVSFSPTVLAVRVDVLFKYSTRRRWAFVDGFIKTVQWKKELFASPYELSFHF